MVRPYHEVVFESVPEVELSGLDSMFSVIKAFKRMKLPSYGAYVIRGAGVQTAISCVDALRPQGSADRKRQEVNLKCAKADSSIMNGMDVDSEVHADEGEENSVTAHVTTEGGVRFMIVTGVTYPQPDNLVTTSLSPEDTRMLYESNRLYLDQADGIRSALIEDAKPGRALRAELYEGDVVVFDHAQLHGFVTQGEVRQSYAYYY